MNAPTFFTFVAFGCALAFLGTSDPLPASVTQSVDARTVAAVERSAPAPNTMVAAAPRDEALTTHEPREPSRRAEVAPEAVQPEPVATVAEPVDPKVAQHHAWCDNRYKTYEPQTATFQPYGDKPRKPCRSPIFRKGLPAQS